MSMPDEHRFPLSGIRVLELGNYIAAPTTGRMLADFGAEVIKIERPGGGDELRNWRLYEGTTSMLFRTVNRNKKSVVLDLRSDEGRQHVLDLARSCDVVVENFRPGTLERWDLGPAALEAANPELVLVRISAFGQTGPMSERPGFAAVAEAYSGFRELVGDPDRPPVRVGVSIGDTIAGMQGAYGAVMALHRLERDRRADLPTRPLAERTIDVALNESMFSVLESLVPDYSAYGVTRTRTGGRIEGISPSNGYVCGDGLSVVVSGNADSIFPRYMETIGRPDLAVDPGLRTNAQRWERRDEVDAAIGEWCTQMARDEVVEVLTAAQIPAGPIYTAADLVADEQLNSRGMIQRMAVSTGERMLEGVAFPGVTPVIGGAALPIRSLGPELGEHTEEVLAMLANHLIPTDNTEDTP